MSRFLPAANKPQKKNFRSSYIEPGKTELAAFARFLDDRTAKLDFKAVKVVKATHIVPYIST